MAKISENNVEGDDDQLKRKQQKWDYTADVVILGYGGAGASAAIAAHDAGAGEVLIFEKAPFGGGNTGCSMGGMCLPNNISDAVEYYRALSFDSVSDEDLIYTFAKEMTELPVKLKEWGIEAKLLRQNYPTFPSLPGAHCMDYWSAGSGDAVYEMLEQHVDRRGIRVFYGKSAKRLIQDTDTGEIRGVIIESKGKEKYVKARKGVVLATGGYQNNFEMQGYYNFPGLKLYPWGTPYNTGDGIKISSAVGADQWHFSSTEFLGAALKAPSDKYGTAIPFMSYSGSFVFVNRHGNMFIDESKSLVHRKDPIEFTYFDHEKAEYPNVPCYCIFDENFRKKGPLYKLGNSTVGYAAWKNLVEWSSDNNAEIEKGWILKADSIEELADRTGIDAGGLKKSIDDYNAYCTADEGSPFGRPADKMAPIDKSPLYAIELCICIINTQGGPRYNSRAQAMGVDNKPIPRLYTPGELGSFFGHLYQGGSNFPEALAFGRIAGENAAADTTWES